MKVLPEGWLPTVISDLAKVESGIGFPKKYQGMDTEDIPVYKVGDISKSVQAGKSSLNESSNYVDEDIRLAMKGKLYPVGSTLFAKIGEALRLNRRGYLSKTGIADNNVMGVIPEPLVESKLMFYFLKTVDLSVFSRSSTVPSIRKGDVEELHFPLSPLPEQKRIVAKLDETLAQVDTIKARLDAIPKILKRFRQSVLASAVSGKLTEEWRVNNASGCAEAELIANFAKNSGKLKLRGKQANLSELSLLTLPTSWTWTQNYKLAKDASNSICAGPFGTIFKAKDFRDEGVPIIFLRHVKEDGFNQNKPNYMDRAVWEDLHQEYSVNGGELLVTKLGDPPGECCSYPENAGTSMVTPDVLKMDVDERCADKKYLRSYFNSPISTEIIEKLAFGVTRLRIDIAMFKGFPVPLPPMEEQKEIVRLVDQYFAFADTIETQVRKAQKRVDNLTQSILSKAFRGELVPQDPNDEPADKLLERIAEARKEAEALAKVAKKTEAAKKRAAKKST
jgi:type I restriction enzyme, S subunit